MQQNDDKDRVLAGVAEAINDGTPVDWSKKTTANGELKEKLGHFRLIEDVAIAHRTPRPARGHSRREALEGEATAEPPAQAGRPDAAGYPTAAGRPAPAGPLPTPASWGPLRIIELLGSGAFGDVYRAFDPSLQREVALKLRRIDRQGDDPAGERFLKEARQLARVRHSAVLVVHGADRHDGRVGLWTDLLRGKTLEDVLAAQGPFGAHEAALVGIDLCHALAAVHAAGLVHRDVKASNIMREQGGRIVLMDFGSVTSRPAAGQPAASDEPVTGTPLYLAPEQVLSEGPATPSSDIYALGVLLFHLVTGRYPIEAQSWSELNDKHARRQRTALRDTRPDLPAAFTRVVGRALDPDPARRFASAGEMEDALAAAIGTAGPGTIPVPAPARRPWWKRPVPVASLAAAAIAVVIAGAALGPRIAPGFFAPGPLTVEATLYRQEPESDDRLLPGSRIHPGDRLFMEVRSQEPVFAYVLNEDANGESYVLFPAGLDLQNPLPAGTTLRLPGRQADKQQTWQITSAGGREKILLIASRRPLEELERQIAGIPRAEAGRQVASAPLVRGSEGVLRGAGGLTGSYARPSDSSGDRLAEITRSLQAAAPARQDVWIWQIELDNPGQP